MSVRKQAWIILDEVVHQGGYASILLRQKLNDFSELDVALGTRIVYGTLQNQQYIRYQWMDLLQTKMPQKIKVLVDMSIYQLLYMDKLPDYAVIHEAVELAKSVNKAKYSRLVNAILREFTRRPPRPLPDDEVEKLALETSHPLWLIQLWKAHYGMEQASSIAQASLRIKPLVARVNPMKIRKQEVLQDDMFLSGHLANGAIICKGNVLQHPWFLDHSITIQDEASQMVVETMQPQRGMKILDMCAAPGTKSCQMAEWIGDEGDITSVDLYETRVAQIQNAIQERQLSSIHPCCMDSTKVQDVFEKESFDMILCDAPCSGLGVLAQKPDIKFHVSPEALDEIVATQKQLLHAAYPLLKQGGTLMYSTCTLNKKENEKQIQAYLKEYSDMECVYERTYFPYEYDTDGFYMAKLIKK